MARSNGTGGGYTRGGYVPSVTTTSGYINFQPVYSYNYGTPGVSRVGLDPVPVRQATELDWLDSQVNEVCKLAR